MSRKCEKCGKCPSTGHNVSHSNRKTKRRFLPNIITKKIYDPAKNVLKKMKICTRCLRTMRKNG